MKKNNSPNVYYHSQNIEKMYVLEAVQVPKGVSAELNKKRVNEICGLLWEIVAMLLRVRLILNRRGKVS